MRKTWTMARSTTDGEHFLEVPDTYWDDFVEAYQRDHTHPAPMPQGHRMFKRPLEYHCQTFEVDAAMLIEACRTENKQARAS